MVRDLLSDYNSGVRAWRVAHSLHLIDVFADFEQECAHVSAGQFFSDFNRCLYTGVHVLVVLIYLTYCSLDFI